MGFIPSRSLFPNPPQSATLIKMRKRMVQQLFMTLLVTLITFLCLPIQAFAANEFTTTLENVQTVDFSGNSHVSKNFTISNNLSTTYLKKYGLELSSTKLKNIRVMDRLTNKKLNANVVVNDNSTTIGIEFPDIIAGKGKKRVFSIEYDDPDTAIISGNILEVYTPRIADPDGFDRYSAVLKIPRKFGQPKLATPSNYTLTTDDEHSILTYDQPDNTEGISIIFGEKQYFDFSLTYNLQNPTGNRGVLQIALPPDTEYQKVKYSEIAPNPEKIEQDMDGNWIATYLLDANQSQSVVAKGIASIYLTPSVETIKVTPQPQHTLADTYWEIEDPVIQNIAKKYSSPQQIFDYSVDTLKYNYDRLSNNENRLGAKSSLEQTDNAVCQEFTDVFVTLARANNIPARQATGFAFTSNSEIRPLSLVQDVLHAWPEYYDEKSQHWIGVDPTWTNTTGGVDYFSHLDFSHFVFAYQGQSSTKPYPAGSYKYEGQDKKDVFVNVTDHDLFVEPKYTVTVTQPLSSFLNVLSSNQLKVTNTTGVAWYHIPVSIKAPDDVQLTLNVAEINALLPYQSIELPFTAIGNEWFKTPEKQLIVRVGESETIQSISASSKLQQLHINPLYIAYFAASCIATAALVFISMQIVKKIVQIRQKRKEES